MNTIHSFPFTTISVLNKISIDRNQESFESQDSFQPFTHPLLSVAKFCQRKNSAPGASLEQRERKSERERESSKGEAADSRRVWGWNEETAGKKGPGTEVYGGGRAKGQGVGETKRPGKKGVAFLNPGHGTLAASLGVNVLR